MPILDEGCKALAQPTGPREQVNDTEFGRHV